LTSTQERIEDVKVSVSLNNLETKVENLDQNEPRILLLNLVDTYLEKTHIADYSERLKVKAELGRKMGQIIVRNNLSKQQLLKDHPKEGMYLALSYSVELKPDRDGLLLLNEISKVVTQLYTKYVMLLAYRTLASSGIIKKEQVKEVYNIIKSFRINADRPLIRNIDDTLMVLNFIDPEIGN
jgi:hypothetical protein